MIKYLGLVVMTLIFSAIVGSHARADFERALTSGVAYPTIDDAIYNNPAMLPDEHGGGAGRLDYDPVRGYSMMYGKASSKSGLGLAMNPAGAGTLTLGGGYNMDWVQVGASLSLNSTYNPTDGDIGVALGFGGLDGFRFVGTMSSLLESASNTMKIGLGYAQNGKYHLELNLSANASSFFSSGSSYAQRFSAVKYFSSFGIGAFEVATFTKSPLGLTGMNFGGMIQYDISGTVSLDVRYSSEPNTGLGFGFLCRM